MSEKSESGDWRVWMLLWLFCLVVNSCHMSASLSEIEDALERMAVESDGE